MRAFMTWSEIIFWTSGALILFSYVGYPLIVLWASRRRGGEPAVAELSDAELPTMSLLIVVYNGAELIERRLLNVLSLDYPEEKLDVVVASDGSTDATCDIVRRYADRGVRLLAYDERRGKTAVIAEAMEHLQGEIVTFSDVAAQFDRGALRSLARWFEDAEVGVVTGRLVLTDSASGSNVDGLYWRIESMLKRREARLGAIVGATGAIYALRRRWFVAPPPRLAVDDFVIPLLAKLRHGCRIAYDAEAVAWQASSGSLRAEFRRRTRIGSGGFQSIRLVWRLLHPRHGWTAVGLASHKLLRWFGPFLLLALLATNALLLEGSDYRVLWYGQCAFYLLAVGGWFLPGRGVAVKMLRMATMFSGMNLALFVGFWRWLLGMQHGTWEPTTRS